MEHKIKKQLLDLLGAALWNVPFDCQNLTPDDWNQGYDCAEKQAVVPLMLKGAALYKAQMPPELLNKLRAYSISVVMRNENLMAAQDRLLALMDAHRIPCAILKGTSLSACYSQSEVRPLGDIDLLVRPEDAERTGQLLCEQGYRPGNADHPFHLDFCGRGAVIEMHWQVSNFPDSKGGRIVKEIMQSALESTDRASLDGHCFPVLKPLHQALSLLLHMERHMTIGGIGLRQLCDWAMFVNSVDAAVFEDQILPEIERCGLQQFAKVLTATCIKCLSMPAVKAPWCREITEGMCNAMMEEIFRGGSMGKASEGKGVSSMLVDRGNDGKQRSALMLMLRNLTELANMHFPITEKWPVLLPFFWIYLPLRYWIRSLQGKRIKVSVTGTLAAARDRRRLYNELRLFDTKNGRKGS